MNETYFDEIVYLLEHILSYAVTEEYSIPFVESRISHSSFFQQVEKSGGVLLPFISEDELIKNIFEVERYGDDSDLRVYKQCAWSAESYCHIQNETQLTFEAIFLYIPIEKMSDYFPANHEMDFSHIVKEFKRLYNSKSILEILIDLREVNIKYLSKELDISYASIFSYKKRRRDIKKMGAELACKLAGVLHVRIETLLEIVN